MVPMGPMGPMCPMGPLGPMGPKGPLGPKGPFPKTVRASGVKGIDQFEDLNWIWVLLIMIAWVGKIKSNIFFKVLARILVWDVVHWIRFAETPNLPVFLRP